MIIAVPLLMRRVLQLAAPWDQSTYDVPSMSRRTVGQYSPGFALPRAQSGCQSGDARQKKKGEPFHPTK